MGGETRQKVPGGCSPPTTKCFIDVFYSFTRCAISKGPNVHSLETVDTQAIKQLGGVHASEDSDIETGFHQIIHYTTLQRQQQSTLPTFSPLASQEWASYQK